MHGKDGLKQNYWVSASIIGWESKAAEPDRAEGIDRGGLRAHRLAPRATRASEPTDREVVTTRHYARAHGPSGTGVPRLGGEPLGGLAKQPAPGELPRRGLLSPLASYAGATFRSRSRTTCSPGAV